MVFPTDRRVIVALHRVAVARAGKPVLANLELSIFEGDRLFVAGENGAGKSTLLALLAGRLHPYGSAGSRSYLWEHDKGENFRTSRRHIAFISREEQHRLQHIHAQSTLREFLLGHSDGADFVYREIAEADTQRADALIAAWQVPHLAERKIRTLSLGEMRLALILRAALFERKLYIFDELFSSLSEAVLARVATWISGLPAGAAVVMTSHDAERAAQLLFTRHFVVTQGRLAETAPAAAVTLSAPPEASSGGKMGFSSGTAEALIACRQAGFFHDFTCIFRELSFSLHMGDRVLLTGPNGSGKSTLLRIMHGDFYPEYGAGSLEFSGPLAHEMKSQLWQKVQLVAAAHFTYFPAYMSVQDVLVSRYSGSIYDYPETLPGEAFAIVDEFSLRDFLTRPFHTLSEGEKTRVLFARAFLFPAPVCLIDEGFIALSHPHFLSAIAHINALPRGAAVVIAANERVGELMHRLTIRPSRWLLEYLQPSATPHPKRAQLTILP